jgi:hypothetical protein
MFTSDICVFFDLPAIALVIANDGRRRSGGQNKGAKQADKGTSEIFHGLCSYLVV